MTPWSWTRAERSTRAFRSSADDGCGRRALRGRPRRISRAATIVLALGCALGDQPAEAAAQSLRGGIAAMREQHRQAVEHDFTKLRDPAHVRKFVELGLLVPLRGNSDYRLHDVGFPYARPQVRLFVERLARQYRSACGEELVVTSLTRPHSHQPRNSMKELSVHPMGMAVDLRRSNSRACRAWLEDVLLHLEGRGLLEATYERNPVHYHVAVYPRQYERYVAMIQEQDAQSVVAEAEAPPEESLASPGRYTVRPGDSLWGIARSHGTTVDRLRAENNIRGSRIYAGQVLRLPAGS